MILIVQTLSGKKTRDRAVFFNFENVIGAGRIYYILADLKLVARTASSDCGHDVDSLQTRVTPFNATEFETKETTEPLSLEIRRCNLRNLLMEANSVAMEASFRCRIPQRGDPGYSGLTGPLTVPPARRPSRLALLRTAGWPILAEPARGSLEAALDRLRAAGVTVLTPEDCDALAAVEAATAEAQQITMGINAWEWRWPLGSFVARDASVLSPSALERHARSLATTQAEYVALLARREEARAAYAALAGQVDAVISVTAPGAAPVGLETTGNPGNPVFVVPGSMLGAPGVSLPVLNDNGLPLGLQHRAEAAGWAQGNRYRIKRLETRIGKRYDAEMQSYGNAITACLALTEIVRGASVS
jgi:hypothetical protein